MEGVFQPGMHSMVHRHPGVEAWFTLEGSMCLETPDGNDHAESRRSRRAGPCWCADDAHGTGTGPRRSVVLILQHATKPRSTMAADWTPRQLCRP